MHLITHIYDFNAQSSFPKDLKKWTLKIKNSTIARVKTSGIKNSIHAWLFLSKDKVHIQQPKIYV